MTVTTSLPAVGIISSISSQSANLSAVLNTSASSATSSVNDTSPDDVSSVALSGQLDAIANQAQPPLNLQASTLNISFIGANVDVLNSGTSEVSGILSQLQSLAAQASLGGLSSSQLQLLNGQFQALRSSIISVPPEPPNSNISVSDLLSQIPGASDSAIGQQAAKSNLTVGGLTADSLLGNSNLLSTDAATQALATVTTAQTKVSGQLDTLSQVQETVDFAAASVDTAVQNQSAATSTLSEADYSTASNSLIARLQSQSQLAQAVQTSNLPNSVLQLL